MCIRDSTHTHTHTHTQILNLFFSQAPAPGPVHSAGGGVSRQYPHPLLSNHRLPCSWRHLVTCAGLACYCCQVKSAGYLVINLSPTSERQSATNQLARADETHFSFDSQFCRTVQNHFLPEKEPGWSYMTESEKRSDISFKHVGIATFVGTYVSGRGILSSGNTLINA